MLSCKKTDSIINVKVEFGEGEGKIPLQSTYRIYCRGKEEAKVANV